MELVTSRYWREADLAGVQFTASRFLQREIRPHRHVGYTLSVSDTELHVRTGPRITVVPPGTLLRVSPQVLHSVQARSAPWSEAAMYCSSIVAGCISTAPAATLARVEDDAGITIFLDDNAASDFLECHRLLCESTASGSQEEALAGRALLRERLAQWIPPQAETANAVLAQAAGSGDARLDLLYELIASGFRQRLTLDELADAVGWHPVHVQKRFKGAWGFTPHEMLVGRRIAYARDLLAGGARVTYAAHAAGFTDQSHLHKTFLSTYGVLPGDYRRLSAFDALQPPAARNGITD